jgi:HAD superfamily hydrolase (TIGR01459 family)
MKPIQGIKEISKDYNYFVFDVWGVLHDGANAYPNVIETLQFLKDEGKRICFLSNAPRRSNKVATVLNRLGITSEFYDFILTSGEATFLDLEANQNSNFKNFGPKYFYIGPDKDLDLMDGLNYQRVLEAADADFIINTGFEGPDSVMGEKMPHIIEAKKHDLPMICVNPDLIVVNQSGKEMICAGALAHEYEKMSGKVFYYGKPFLSVYKMTLEKFGNPNKNEVIAIGDGMETDITGAKNFEIDSILVTGGILANRLGVKFHQQADLNKLTEICESYKTFPKFVISNLKLS